MRRPHFSSNGRGGGDDSGQMIITAALAVTLALVVISLSFSDLVYSGSFSARSALDTTKADIFELTQKVTAEVKKAAALANTSSGPDNATFYNYLANFTSSLRRFYALRGAVVNVTVNNLTIGFASNTSGGQVDVQPHTFPAGSIVIPMDQNQSNRTLNNNPNTSQLTAYGLVYRILNPIDAAATFNTSAADGIVTSLPWHVDVFWVLQQANDTRNTTGNYSFRADTTNTTNWARATRNYSGGLFLIDGSQINSTQNSSIFAAAREMGVVLHKLESSITVSAGTLLRAPKWAFDKKFVKYLARDAGIGADPVNFNAYYANWQEDATQEESSYKIVDKYGNTVPAWVNVEYVGAYSNSGDAWMRAGSLNDSYDAILMDHPGGGWTWDAALGDLVADYVEAGGLVGVQCDPAEDLDSAVALARGNTYGFIGVTGKGSSEPAAPGWKFTNNSSESFAQVYSYNGYHDSGAGGSGRRFELNAVHNPNVSIISWVDTDGDGNYDTGAAGDKYGMLSAKIGNGWARYLAGHNQERSTGGSDPPASGTPDVQRVRLAINQAFYGALGKASTNAITSANVTLTYVDSGSGYNVTLRIPVP